MVLGSSDEGVLAGVSLNNVLVVCWRRVLLEADVMAGLSIWVGVLASLSLLTKAL